MNWQDSELSNTPADFLDDASAAVALGIAGHGDKWELLAHPDRVATVDASVSDVESFHIQPHRLVPVVPDARVVAAVATISAPPFLPVHRVRLAGTLEALS